MFIREATLDDLLHSAFEKLIKKGSLVTASRGETKELESVLLRLTNPRARLSHTEKKGMVFSRLGELAWYLAKSNNVKFISYYLKRYKKDAEVDGTIFGAYGPRIFGMNGVNQFENVIKLLQEKRTSRQAVIQLFDARDLVESHKIIPCTCSLQFMIRHDRLNMSTTMRSNDAYIGLPHDVFSFTMIQEIMARILNCDLGEYSHFAGSLHLYTDNARAVQQYLDEGFQPTQNVAMPPMPAGDPLPSIQVFLQAESAIRAGKSPTKTVQSLDHYWQDLVRLLQVFRYSKKQKPKEITRLKKQMTSPVYAEYITRKEKAKRTAPQSGQPELFGDSSADPETDDTR
jgi:thymidylate synthase